MTLYYLRAALLDIFRLWQRELLPALLCGAAAAGIYIAFSDRTAKAGKPIGGNRRTAAAFLLGMYLLYLFSAAFLTREAGSGKGINLKLFSTIYPYGRQYAIENMFMMMPLGLLMPVIFPAHRKKCIGLLTGFLLALGIELTQLITGLGNFELDDILFNGLGEIAGWMLFCGLHRIIYRRGSVLRDK